MQKANQVKEFTSKFEDGVEGLCPMMSYILFLEMALHFTSSETYQGYSHKSSFDKFVHVMRLKLKQEALRDFNCT